MARHRGHKGFSPIKAHRGSGPTKTAGHIESVMGSQYPAKMNVRQTGGTGRKRAR